MAPSMSNLASLRVLPPFSMERAMSSSRAACSALLQDPSRAPRWAKVSSRRAGPPCERPNSTAAPKSVPALEVRASGSSVAGFTSVANGSLPSIHRPPTKLRSVFMARLLAQFLVRRRTRHLLLVVRRLRSRAGQGAGHLGQRISDHRDGGGIPGQVCRIDLVERVRGGV